jgi:type II secretory pathway pseudopilin PulG
MIVIIIVAVVGAVVLTGLGRTVRIVPQARACVVERLGSYSRTLDAGLRAHPAEPPFIPRDGPITLAATGVTASRPAPRRWPARTPPAPG